MWFWWRVVYVNAGKWLILRLEVLMVMVLGTLTLPQTLALLKPPPSSARLFIAGCLTSPRSGQAPPVLGAAARVLCLAEPCECKMIRPQRVVHLLLATC